MFLKYVDVYKYVKNDYEYVIGKLILHVIQLFQVIEFAKMSYLIATKLHMTLHLKLIP